jgi:hypothetical protein
MRGSRFVLLTSCNGNVGRWSAVLVTLVLARSLRESGPGRAPGFCPRCARKPETETICAPESPGSSKPCSVSASDRRQRLAAACPTYLPSCPSREGASPFASEHERQVARSLWRHNPAHVKHGLVSTCRSSMYASIFDLGKSLIMIATFSGDVQGMSCG